VGFNIGQLYLELLADGGRLLQSIEQEGANAAGKAGGKVGGTLGQSIARNAQRGLTVAGAAVGTFVTSGVEQFGAFQQRMNEVFTLLPDITSEQMGKMSDDVKAFSRETGKLPDEVIPALYQAISAGVPQDNVFDFLRTANKGAVAGVAKTADEVSLLSAVTKGYGDTSQAAVTEAADLSQLMVKLGQTTIPELAASYGKAVPLAAALGIGNEQLAAASASLFGVTGNTAEVMTQLKAVFTAMIQQNPALTAGLKEMGYGTTQEAIAALGLKGTLDGLVETTGGSTQKLQAMLGSSEALTSAIALTDAQAGTFTNNLEAMGDGAGTVDEAFKTMDSGIKASGDKLAATAATIAIDVGEKFQALGPFLLALNQGGQLFGVSPAKLIGGAVGGIAGKLAGKLGPALGRGLGQAVARAAPAAIATGVAEAGASSAVAGAATGAGTTIGGLMAAAIPFALVAAAGVGIALAFKAIVLDPGLQEQAREIGKAAAEQIVEGTTEELRIGKAAIEQGIADIEALPLGGLLYGDQVRELQTQLDAYTAELERRGERIPEAVAAGLDRGAHWVNEAIGEMYGPMTPSPEVLARLGAAAQKIPESIADGVLARQNRVVDAMDTLRNLMKNALRPAQRATRGIGLLIGDELAGALDDKRGAVRKEAERVQAVAVKELAQIIGRGGKAGEKAMDALEEAIKHGTPKARRRAREVKEAVVERLEATKGPASEAGEAAGEAFAARLKRAIATGDFTINASVGFTLPGHARGGIARRGVPAVFGEEGPEIGIPEADYRIFTHQQSVEMVRGTSGGFSPSITIYNPEPRAADEDIGRMLRRTAALGMS
jgi:TP901 family phage tail tape measure protein